MFINSFFVSIPILLTETFNNDAFLMSMQSYK